MSSAENEKVYNPSLCGVCKKQYTRLSSLNEHYVSQKIRKGGKLVANPCYQANKRVRFKSLDEANEAEKHIKINNYFESLPSKKPKLDEQTTENTPEVSANDEIIQTFSRDEIPSTSAIGQTTSTSAIDETFSNISNDKMPTESINYETKELNQLNREVFTKDFRNCSYMNENIDSKLNTIIEKEDYILREIANLKRSEGNTPNEKSNPKDNEIENDDCFKSIRLAKSIAEIMKNRLIQNIFEIETDNTTDISTLCCKKCENFPNTRDVGIIMQNTTYNSYTCSGKQPYWFVNMKTSLLKHIKKETHLKNLKDSIQAQTKLNSIKIDIMKAMRYISYFAIKSELSFQNFPTLLATVIKCKVELGNINHSEYYIVKYLECLNRILIDETVKWLDAQEDNTVSVTLDIGTCYGITLLAVLFIAKKEVKIANVLMSTSKKGEFLADLCVEALKMGDNVQIETLKKKIVGLVGDGAFIKGNKPFKNRMEFLLSKKLKFRWDLLHLVNRAHVPARGVSPLEKKKKSDIPEEVELDTEIEEDFNLDVDVEPESNDNIGSITGNADLRIPKTIGYIQTTAKKFRTGIKYTELLQSTLGAFSRPKIWSSTRMVLYELDMLARFLENKVYYEVPVEIELTASMYCLVMFSLKIMLKMVQKTDVSWEFVNAVFLNEEINYGEKCMLSVLEIATQQVSVGYHEVISELPDILSHPVELKGTEDNKFYMELKNFIAKHKENLLLKDVERRETRNTPTKVALIEEIRLEIKDYISKLWLGIRNRLDVADTREFNCVSFSEAPAEGVFSVWERITAGKTSLTLAHANAMLRVSKEGPKAGTNKALQISEKALDLWPSGERFTTINWMPGMVSKSVKKVFES